MKKKVAFGSIVLVVFLAAGSAFLPRLANHFGFALPIADGLPYRVFYLDRAYSSSDHMCAGAGWCRPQPSCSSLSELNEKGYSPLTQIGTVHTLFGPDHPIVTGRTIQDSPPTIVWVSYSRDCYLTYALMGGP
jgi:hypothetical protein